MSNDVFIEQSASTAKVRNPWLVLIFTTISFGIYGWFWWYQVNRELAEFGKVRGTTELGDRPGLSTAAYSIGAFVFVPLVITVITTNRRAIRAQERTVGRSLKTWVAVLLWVFTLGIGGPVYLQRELNKVWRAPGMRQSRDPLPGDAERAAKLDELRDAGTLSEAEYEAERVRLSYS